MRTSVTCLNSGAGPASARGFTLLELMIVLALVGLVAALAVPNLQRLYDSVTRATERDYILDQLSGLGMQAMHKGLNYVVVGTANRSVQDDRGDILAAPLGYEPFPLDVPAGWRVRVDEPLLARANGVCLGGALTLLPTGGAPIHVELQPPYCRLDAAT